MIAFLQFLELNYSKDKYPQELLGLFEIINSCLPDIQHKNLQKDIVYSKIYPSQKWISGKLDKLLTRYLKAIFQFIGIHFNTDTSNTRLNLCKFLLERGLDSIFDREFKKWGKELETKQIYSSEVLMERFLFREIQTERLGINLHSKQTSKLPEMLQSLDQYYIFTKLKYACKLLSINSFLLKVNLQDSLKSFIHLDHLIELPHLQIPIISVYYQAYKMLSLESEFGVENFKKFKRSLEENHEHLTNEQQKSLNTLIRNYAVKQYTQGEDFYLKNAFEIYKEHLEKGYMYHQGKIHSLPLRNIVTFGLRLGEFDWVHQFILDHKDRIDGSESPEQIYNFNLALYYFHIENYSKALNILPPDFDDIYYKTSVKRLELIILFDTDSPIIDSRIDAFKIFIYRIPDAKISPKHKVANNNFIHLLKQIRHPKTEFSKPRIDKLKTKVSETDLLAEKDWLLKKLDQFLNQD